eukprot:TRINITY_DN10931_c0_g2_i1.p1 TRINITY_DN10931_c0_g2~~TRINITY_DN10931_c0_g2_i1.p1  ORF type:complete len:118 (-),score=27.71 TRINITY_DN10931_c0_g2_i1:32-346(-)
MYRPASTPSQTTQSSVPLQTNTTSQTILQNTPSDFTKITDLRPFKQGINVMFIVLEKVTSTKTKEDHTINQYLVADSSGSIHLTLWQDKGQLLLPGDILQLRGG